MTPVDKKSRIAKLSGHVAAISSLIVAGKSLWEVYNSRPKKDTGISLLFRENDEAYRWLIDWISDHPNRSNSDSFLVSFKSNRRIGEDCAMPVCGNEPAQRDYSARLTPFREFKFEFGGVKCCVNRPVELPASDEKSKSKWLPDEMVVHFATKRFSVCAAFVEELQATAKEKSKEPPKVYAWNYGWRFARHCPPSRSVVLPDGMLSDLIEDMRRFQGAREWYEYRGMPYRRGYLFYGVPGSGKTSTVLCAANELDRNIYWLSLSGLSDAQIRDAFQQVSENSIVLLEDVDCAFEERVNKEGEGALTFSGLLNALDGVASQEGRMVVMTTNHIERLDPALIRPGRIDRQIEFGNATTNQILELAKRFIGDTGEAQDIANSWGRESISMAVVQERLIQQVLQS